MGMVVVVFALSSLTLAYYANQRWPGWACPVHPDHVEEWKQKHAWCRLMWVGAGVCLLVGLAFLWPMLQMHALLGRW